MAEPYGHALGVLRILEIQEKTNRERAADPNYSEQARNLFRQAAADAAKKAEDKRAYLESIPEDFEG